MAASMVRRFAGLSLSPVVKTGCPGVLRCMSTISQLPCKQSYLTQRLSIPTTNIIPSGSVPVTRSLLRVCAPFVTSCRTVVRYSRREGKPKTVKAVVNRFYRLHWGIYIRTRAGRNKKKWKKPEWLNERNKHHVFTNKTQSRMFDKMVTSYWKKIRHYPNDPYAPYNKQPQCAGRPKPPKFLP